MAVGLDILCFLNLRFFDTPQKLARNAFIWLIVWSTTALSGPLALYFTSYNI